MSKRIRTIISFCIVLAMLMSQFTMAVSAQEAAVQSITATAQNVLIENSGGEDYGDYYYYYMENCNPIYTVTMKNGTVHTGDAWDIDSAIGYWPNISIEQSAENPLTVGKHNAEVEICGVKGVCEIEIVETPVASITATAQKTLIENSGGEDYGDYYNYYLDNCEPVYTVTMKDGTVHTGYMWDIESAIGYQPNISIEQSAENPLTVGKHNANVEICGVKGVCEIEIVETPVASIIATARKTLIENCDGYDCGDYYIYYLDNCDPIYTVTMKDGMVYKGNGWDIYEVVGYTPSLNIEQSAENPLTVGKHNAEVSLCGVKSVCQIEIVKNPVLNVTLKSKSLRYNVDKYDDNAIITVRYKDGTVHTGTKEKIYELTGYEPSIEWYEAEQKLGTNLGNITFLGKTFLFSYQVVENPYASLEIISVEPMKQAETYPYPEFTYKLVQKDGTAEIREVKKDSWYGENCLPLSVEKIGEWGPGKENKFTVTVAGLTAEGSVEITPKNLDYSYVLFDDSNIIITEVCHPSEIITIPEKIDGYTVIGISSLIDSYNYTDNTKKIILPDSIKFLAHNWLGRYSNSASIEQITIGAGVQNLDYEMFKYLPKLKQFDVSESNPLYKSVNGAVYTKDMSTLVVYPRGGEKNYVIPKETSNIDILHDVIYDGINISFSENSKDYVVKDGVTYTADMKKIISCSTEKSGAYVMPQSVEQINDRAFADCNKLESVSVSENVTEIVYGTFADCTALKDITLPNSVKSIGREAFGNCTALPSIALPDSVETIGVRAFINCSGFTEFTIPDSVTTLPGGYNFYYEYPLKDCKALKTLNVGSGLNEGLESIYSRYGLDSLTNINISEGNAMYSSIDGAVYSKDKTEIMKYPYARTAAAFTIPDGVKTSAATAFLDCSSLAEINFPNSFEYAEYETFNDTAWYKEKNNYENGVLYAGKCLLVADSKNNFGNYAIKPGTKTIAESAFSYCTTLTSISIPDSVTNIGDSAFKCCTSLTSVTIPDGVTSIGYDVFEGCTSLTSVTIPSSVTKIADGAFNGCTSLTSVTIPSSVTEIGAGAFKNCPLGEIKLPKGLETVGYMAFAGTNVKSIEIPNMVTDMVYGFYNTNISEIKMPDKLVSMECDFDKTPWLEAQPEGQVYLGRMLYKYKGWINNYSDVTVKDGTLGVSGSAFAGQFNLVNVFLPEGLLEIGTNAFGGCSNLKSPVLPSTLKTIRKEAFTKCSSLDSITIPASVTKIEDEAFDKCENLKEINVSPDNPVYSSVDGVLYNKDKTELIYCPEGKTGTLVLPSQTVKINQWAIGNNSLSAVVINNDNLEGYQYILNKCWYGNVGTAAYEYAKSDGRIVYIPFSNLTDKATDISISENVPNSVAEGSVLTVKTVEKTDSKVTIDISLVKNGIEVQPTGDVTVKIPVPNTMNSADCRVYRQEADGSFTDMDAVYKDGYMLFTTDHFSVYVLTTGNPNRLLGDVNDDGIIDASDYAMVISYIMCQSVLTEEQKEFADWNKDGAVDGFDAIAIDLIINKVIDY